MIRLNCDYLEGAHPNILTRLLTTNYDQTIPYGFDEITKNAKDKIKKACNCENGEVFFMVGGTQTNATMLDFILEKGEGVIAIEQRLTALGYMDKADEDFTEETMDAVRLFKAYNGMSVENTVEFDFIAYLNNIEYDKQYEEVDRQFEAAYNYLKELDK